MPDLKPPISSLQPPSAMNSRTPAFCAFAPLWCCALAMLAALPLCGCQLLVGHERPVTKQMAASRQLSQQGISALDRGEWESGETLLAQAIKSCPADPEPHRHYGEAMWHRGAREEGLAQMREAMRLSSDDPQLVVRCGEMCLALGRINEAKLLADEALDLCPKQGSAWALRGAVAAAMGQIDDALADYHRGLEYLPDDKRLLLATAELYQQQGRPGRALSLLEALRDLYPAGEEPQRVLYLEGLALTGVARFDDAIETYTLALGRDRPTAEIYYRIAEAQLSAGRVAEAGGAVQQALALNPSHEPSRILWQRVELASRPPDGLRR
jgi:tetratricopeptide (TPR) repeat protein